MSAVGTWRALSPWLQDLIWSPSPEIRLNVAMLAADLAADDVDARRELANMLARTCDGMVRVGASEDRVLFRRLTQERLRIPDQQRSALDRNLIRALEKISEFWPPQRAVDVLLIEEKAGILLPIQILAQAVEEDARSLSLADQGSNADRARARLAAVNRADQQTTPKRRDELRRELRERLQKLSATERRSAVFHIFRTAPNLFEEINGSRLADESELDAAARAGRPSLRWTLLCSLLTALALSAGLTLIVAMTAPLSSETEGLPYDSSLWGFAMLLVLIGFVSGLIIGPVYTPSVGRRESWQRTLVRVVWPAMVLYLAVTAVAGVCALISRDTDILGGFAFLLASDVEILIIGVLLPAVIIYMRVRTQAYSVAFFSYAIAGPVIAAVTVVCGFAVLLHISALNQFWAPTILTATCASVMIVAIELGTLPPVQPRSYPSWVRGTPALAATACYAMIIIPATYVLLVHIMKPNGNLIDISSQGRITRTVDPEHRITLVNNGADTLKISAEDHKVLLPSKPPKELKEITIAPHSKRTICIDICRPEAWPDIDRWLPLLMLRSPAIDVTLDVTSIPG